MGITKTDLFSERQNRLSEMAKVLGHPARIAIIEQLLEKNVCVNGDLVKELGLAQATISQHLKELKHQHLIEGTIEGNSMCYCLSASTWSEYEKEFHSLFDEVKCHCDGNCC